MRPCTKTSVRVRLHQIEEQVRDAAVLIEAGDRCDGALRLMVAARTALDAVEQEIVWAHVAECVAEAVVVGDRTAGRTKVDEIVKALGYVRR